MEVKQSAVMAHLWQIEECIADRVADCAHACTLIQGYGGLSAPAEQVQRAAASEGEHNSLTVGKGIPAQHDMILQMWAIQYA